MTEKAAVLQNYNQEMVKYIEILKRRKAKIEHEILSDEKTKDHISQQMKLLQQKQEELDEQIAKRKIAYAKVLDTLQQSEIGYSKIIDSLQVLLHFAASKSDAADDGSS